MFKHPEQNSLRIVCMMALLFAAAILGRLFILQVMQYKYYAALAMNTHEIYRQLYPRRGNIYFKDSRANSEYPAAINRQYYLVYAVPRDIAKDQVVSTTNFLSDLFKFDETQKDLLLQKLSRGSDPYEPVAKKAPEEIIDAIKKNDLKGVNFIGQEYRYYPESNLASNVLGFARISEDGQSVGNYGIEGFWNKELSGQPGFLAAERGALGSLIPLAGQTTRPAQDGADILLTLDRNIENYACQRLKDGFQTYKARSAALVMMDPNTGALLALCSYPDYDPNNYAKVNDISAYNNTAIFTPYEPGSVFKPITMAIALDLGLVSPDTTFTDPGVRVINGHKIRNALQKKYGTVSMTSVLENSINMGIIWVEEKIGQRSFKEYIDKFGLGKKTGINIDTEAEGNVLSFSKTGAIYGANASFGQGFTATPIQLATVYSALANGGKLPVPYIVDEVRFPNGKITKAAPRGDDMVLLPQTSKLITGMLVSVVEKGHGKVAKLDNYYVAAKTGTAQIASRGVYTDESNHTFMGYFPATNPKFLLLVKYEAPQRQWAESTAAPVFKDIAKFTLDYYGIEGDRK